MKPILSTVVFFLLCAAAVPADADLSLIDDKDAIILGISLFSGINLEEESEYLTTNIPSLLREQLLQFPFHYLREKEVTAYKSRLKEKAVEKRQEELHNLYSERDKLFLSQSPGEEQIKQFSEKSGDLLEEIEAIRDINDSEIVVEDKKKIEIFNSETNAGLLQAEAIDIEGLCGKHGLDIFISGKIEQIEEYYFIEVSVWNDILQEEVLLTEDAGSRDNLRDVVRRIVQTTYNVVVGEKWSFVDVSVSPEEGNMYIDDEYVGNGRVENVYIEPGIHVFSADAPGYLRTEREVAVAPRETRKIQLQLSRKEEKTLLISSIPKKANVYAGALWIGTTPLLLPVPDNEMQRIMITKEDYSNVYVNIGPEDRGNIEIFLPPYRFNSSDYLEKKRDSFYLAAGFFVLAFPIPFFLYSITEDLASGFSVALANENYAEMEKKMRASVAVYHAHLGSIVVVGSLLINTLFRLAEYIRASELY